MSFIRTRWKEMVPSNISQFGKIIKQGDRHRRDFCFFPLRERKREKKKKKKKKKKKNSPCFPIPYLEQMTPAIEQ